MLKRKGLQPADYKLVSVGGTAQRAQALGEMKQAGTSLTPPFDIQLMSRGFNRLAGSTEAVGRLEGGVALARRAWAKDNEAKIVGFARATIDSVNWMFDRANKDEAVAILRKYLPQVSPEAAAASYELQFDPVRGTKKTVGIDIEAVRNVMAIRSAYAEPKKDLSDPMRYVDLSYLQKAAAR
jgi:ABC-type nitrate/sulfonate/bicarbonate transport system substrate-binding protein